MRKKISKLRRSPRNHKSSARFRHDLNDFIPESEDPISTFLSLIVFMVFLGIILILIMPS